MGVGRVHLYWHFDEDAWSQADQRPEHAPLSLAGSVRRVDPAMLLVWTALLVGLLYAAYASWLAPQRQMRQAIADQLDLEAALWLAGDLEGLNQALDPQARPEWARWYRTHNLWRRNGSGPLARLPTTQIQAIRPLDGQRVLVTVAYTAADPGPTYQEGIVFRAVGNRWLRTSPDDTLWGVLYLEQAGPLRFEYREMDATAVQPLMQVGQEMVVRLQDLLPGTLSISPERPLTVAVHADPVRVRRSAILEGRLHLLSPLLDRRLAQDTPTQALSRSMAMVLAQHATIRLLPRYGYFDPRWGALFRGFSAWLAREINPLVDGSVPEDLSPLVQRVAADGLPTLFDLRRRHQGYPWNDSWVDLAAQSLFAYTVETYPVDDVGALFRSMMAGVGWERWTRSNLGISAAEYEAGWHAYLQEHWLAP